MENNRTNPISVTNKARELKMFLNKSQKKVIWADHSYIHVSPIVFFKIYGRVFCIIMC